MQKEYKEGRFLQRTRPFIISLHPMKRCSYILFLLLFIAVNVGAQSSGSRGRRGTFSLANLTSSQAEIPDSILFADSVKSSRTAYRIDPYLGEMYVAPMDTGRFNAGNNTLMENRSLGIAYLGNIGSPAQTKIFSERKESRDFIFADPYDYFITTPENALFYDTKVPYTHVTYTRGGSQQNQEDQLKGLLTLNFGKKINVGAEMDYIYGRGHYASNGNKLLTYRFFGSYRSDRYEMKAYVMNFNSINHENGGLTIDEYLTDPDQFADEKRNVEAKAYPTRYADAVNATNRVRGKQFYLTHRYNLGFNRVLETVTDADGNDSTVFVPVSSIIHTLSYQDNRRHFRANTGTLDSAYVNHNIGDLYESPDSAISDRPSAWNLQNTFGLSLREGFQDWVKFGLTAFIRLEKRQFKTALFDNEAVDNYNDNDPNANKQDWIVPGAFQKYDEFSTYIGAQLSKQRGSLFTYNAHGELCIVGDDIGEFRINGELQTRFPLFKKEAIIQAEGYIRNVTPAFYLRHHRSRYFYWDNKFDNEQHFYGGAKVGLQSTGTELSAGINSIQHYIYIDNKGYPAQYDKNVQVVTLRLKQDLRYRAFNWENEAAYQLSSKKEVLPLPEFTAYSNMYLAFRLAKVLTVQLGADMHYHTKYNAPYYEPATQQFQNQTDVKVGGYPLINAYANMHLKQARFFIMAYNLGSKFVDPNYFSLAHYPMNPMVLKMGVSVVFNK